MTLLLDILPAAVLIPLSLFILLLLFFLISIIISIISFRQQKIKNLVNSEPRTSLTGNGIGNATILKELKADGTSGFNPIYERIIEPFIAIDTNWNYLYVNGKAAEIMQREAKELIGKNAWEVFPEAVDGEIYNAYHAAMSTNEQTVIELYYPAFDRWLENHIYPSPEGLSIFYRDVTAQKKDAESVLKANRLYHFISEFNQMMLRSESEENLYVKVCQIAIQTGKFRMAWVGLINDETQMVEPVVFDGAEEGYLGNIRICLDGSIPESQGPVGYAIREGRYNICNDMETDPRLAPWSAAAAERNFQSVMVVPIRKGRVVIGVLVFYADKKHFFDEPETRLLNEAGENLSFALDLLEKEKWRKHSLEAILESERRYETLTRISPVGIFHTTKEGYTTYVNPFWCSLSGIRDADALGNGWMTAVHPEDRLHLREGWNKATKEKHNSFSEYRFLRPDGSIVWVLGQAIPELDESGQIVGYVGTITNITERKKAEVALKQTTEKYRKAQVIGKMGHWELDITTKELSWSDEIFSIFDTSSQSSSGRYDRFLNAIHPEDRATVEEALEKAIGSKGKIDYTHRIINSEGKISYVQEQGEFLYNDQGKPVLTGTAQDVTEIIKARDEIIKERNVSDSIINSLPGIFYVFTREGKYLRWNHNLETITGYTTEEIRGMSPSDLVHPDEKEKITNAITETFTTGESSIQGLLVCKDKSTVSYYYTGLTIIYEGELCLMGVGIDTSERELAKQKLRETSQQLRELTSHLVKVREEERKRIGREIHDELGQKLTAIKMDVAWLNKKLPDENILFRDKFRNILAMLDDGNHSIRRILSELRPAILDNFGLLEALLWQTQHFTATTNIPVKINTLESKLLIPENIATSLFRIFQEALTNIARYSQATEVVISINISEEVLLCAIEDDGIGFDPDILNHKKSFGVLGMKERIGSLNGTFKLITSVNNGTKLEITIPIAGQNLNDTIDGN